MDARDSRDLDGAIDDVARAMTGTELARPANWNRFADTYINVAAAGVRALSIIPGFTAGANILSEAIRGVGGTTRLVMLPFESHGYLARESNQHVVYEMVNWFDRYVKNAPARSKPAQVGEMMQH